VIDRFYRAASEVLIDAGALIEKLISDEITAIFPPGFAEPKLDTTTGRARTTPPRRDPGITGRPACAPRGRVQAGVPGVAIIGEPF
jgi:hypothetical protein